jgi:hypothetical protein
MEVKSTIGCTHMQPKRGLAIDLTTNSTTTRHCQYTRAEAAAIINTQTIYNHKLLSPLMLLLFRLQRYKKFG